MKKNMPILKCIIGIYIIGIYIIGMIVFSILIYNLGIKEMEIEITEIGATRIELDFNDREEHRLAFYNLLEVTAEEVAKSHEYELHIFDCTDFSRELRDKLRDKGLKADCVYGLYTPSDYEKHTWVEVDVGKIISIEATAGFIIPNDYLEEHYTIKSKGRCL